MTPEQLKTLLDNVVTEVNAVADYAAGVDPALLPFIAMGKAVDKLIPGLAENVDRWIQGNPPTDAEKAETLAQIKVLGDPNLP